MDVPVLVVDTLFSHSVFVGMSEGSRPFVRDETMEDLDRLLEMMDRRPDLMDTDHKLQVALEYAIEQREFEREFGT